MKRHSLPCSMPPFWAFLTGLALRLYPKSFRRSMGADLLRLYRDVGFFNSPAGSLSALWDLLRNALAVRWDEAGSRLGRQAPPKPCTPSPGRPGLKGQIGESMFADLRFALHSLVRTPLFAAAATLTLALGVGANAAIFSVLNAVVLQPLPYSEPDRLALVWPQKTFNKHMLGFFQRESKAFQAVTAFSGWILTLTGDGEPERLSGAQVAHNYFQTLGVAPALGRDFGPADVEPGNTEVAILSHGLWQRRFGGDPEILGRLIQLSIEERHSFTVVGVMPQGYLPLEGAGTWQVWVPLPRALNPGLDSAWYLTAVGRLESGTSMEEAGAEVGQLAATVKERFYPRISEERVRLAAPMPLSQALVGETVRTRLWVLLGAVGLILLIACANVGNLLLARLTSRRKELAVRRALGATAGRLVRLLLMESLLLAAAGGAAGLMVCGLLLSLASGYLPDDLPRSEGIRIDLAVLAFALSVSLLSALAYCLAPAWKVIRAGRRPELQTRGASLTPESRRISSGLVGAEIALSVILAAGSLLLIQSFFKLSQVSPGFSSRQILTLAISTPDRWPREEKHL
ncbi:MAG: ABC transporter permease, partial [Acidobacteriota bacterium]